VSSSSRKHKTASEAGIVLGVVFLIMGFTYGNSGIWMLGGIFLAIGLVSRLKGRTDKDGRSDSA
jgi:hypothetical protein